MIYIKKTDEDGCLLKVERGMRIPVDAQNISITGREYSCLVCALRACLDHCDPETFSQKDWGITDG